MAKIKQSPKLPAEKRRQQLLSAARKLFVKKGFRGTTTDEIARKARLTKGALYHHFGCKEDILFALLEDLSAQYKRALEPLTGRRNISPMDIFEALLHTHKSEDLAEFRNLIDVWVQAIRIPRIMKSLTEGYQELADKLAAFMDPAFGRTLRERRELVLFTFAFYDGVASRKCVNPDVIDVTSQSKLFARCTNALKSATAAK